MSCKTLTVSTMRTHTRPVMRLPRALGLLAVCSLAGLAGCILDGRSEARTDTACFVGGCAAEVCSDRDDVVTPCIWHDAFVCYRAARCERQSDGACGWTQTSELAACLASHDSLSR
jgi:hypothetical protein